MVLPTQDLKEPKKLICYGNYHPNLGGKFKGLSFYFLAFCKQKLKPLKWRL